MDAMRKQLDVLMGANRDGGEKVTPMYYDRNVCRLYLAGLCPQELFQLSKINKGSCPKIHSLQLRKEYEEAKAKGLHNYDRDLEDNIERLIAKCDRKIASDAKTVTIISVSEIPQTPEIIELSKKIRAKLKEADQSDLEGKTELKIRALEVIKELTIERANMQSKLVHDALNKDQAPLPQPLTNAPQLAPVPAGVPDPHIVEMINKKLKEAEDLGDQGMIDEAQKAVEEAEALKKLLPARQEPEGDSSKNTAADVRILAQTDEKLRICDICGAFLNTHERLLGHVIRGKLLQLKNIDMTRDSVYLDFSDHHLADHLGGRLHIGYMKIREKLAELQEEKDKKRKAIDGMMRAKSVDRRRRGRDGGDSRDHGRDQDRRIRDRDNDRERERERNRSRSYDSRSRRRSRSRTRGYDHRRF